MLPYSVFGKNSDLAIVRGVDNIQDMTISSSYLSRCSSSVRIQGLLITTVRPLPCTHFSFFSYGTKRLDIFINRNVLINIKTLNTTYIEVPDKTCPSTL